MVPESAMPQKAAVTTPSACSISAVARPRSIFQSKPAASHSAGSPQERQKMPAAGGELRRDGGRQSCRRGFDHLGVVLAQALDHQFDAGLSAQFAVADIVARQAA